MSSLEEIRQERIKKLNLLKEKGIDPYPLSVSTGFSFVGRIRAIRSHGGSIFFDIDDGSTSLTTGGTLQAYLKKDEVGESDFSLFIDTVDIGDFVELKGTLFRTKKKEKTIRVLKWRMLVKTLRPLPEKWHGLTDIEERFRKRYLDLLMNKEVKEKFLLRSKIISEIRTLLDKEGFIEVETPILQNLAGGALAEPFITHHNALDIDLYLRLAPELFLKKLLVGGFNKVYEMGKDFRNEGIDAIHNPEFTMLELYLSYQDAQYLRQFTEKFIKEIIKKVSRKKEIVFGEHKISFLKKFNTLAYFEVLKRFALIPEPENSSRDDFSLKAKQFGIRVEDFETREKIMDNIFKKICRPKIIQPTFVIDYPVGATPLAKRKPENKEMIDRFQLIIGGLEIVNGFSELNDPIDQRQRFAEQDKMKERGEKSVSPSDEDYLEALEYGMPLAAGLGLGIDRLIMLLTNTHNIKEVILFPILRPKNNTRE